jgi:hypothetical protein
MSKSDKVRSSLGFRNDQANLGLATTRELLEELRLRAGHHPSLCTQSQLEVRRTIEEALDLYLLPGVLPEDFLEYRTWTPNG